MRLRACSVDRNQGVDIDNHRSDLMRGEYHLSVETWACPEIHQAVAAPPQERPRSWV